MWPAAIDWLLISAPGWYLRAGSVGEQRRKRWSSCCSVVTRTDWLAVSQAALFHPVQQHWLEWPGLAFYDKQHTPRSARYIDIMTRNCSVWWGDSSIRNNQSVNVQPIIKYNLILDIVLCQDHMIYIKRSCCSPLILEFRHNITSQEGLNTVHSL